MSERVNSEDLKVLERISRLLIELATKDMNQTEQIAMLSRVGYEPKEIANIVDTTANTVRVTLAHQRKKAKSSKK